MKIKALTFISLCAVVSLPVAFLGETAGAGESSATASRYPLNVMETPFELGSGEINRLISPVGYQCPLPDLMVKATAGCDRGKTYPECKWQVPPEHRAKGLYKVWWRTPPWELWGSSDLIRLILSSVYMYKRRYPRDDVYIGDLDAPSGGHFSHDRGVDVDVYLLRWMEWIQVKDAKYVNNMRWRTEDSKKLAREKTLYLARSFAICGAGRAQIFYNDPEVVGPFNRWFRASGYASPFGLPMVRHNGTHHDHFHVRIPEPLF